jgi:hypothetical protein
MAGERIEIRAVQATRRALSLVTEAMDLLDAHSVAPHSAAHLAIAQQQLRELVRS